MQQGVKFTEVEHLMFFCGHFDLTSHTQTYTQHTQGPLCLKGGVQLCLKKKKKKNILALNVRNLSKDKKIKLVEYRNKYYKMRKNALL